MSVTLTDAKHAELVRMLDTVVRGCDARAYDIGLSLDPLRELLEELSSLTREPAPAGVRPSLEDVLRSAAEAAEADAHPDPMDFPTLTFVAPAPCPHLEAFAVFREAVELECKCLAGRTCESCLITSAADSALQQPCAAPAGCQHRDLEPIRQRIAQATAFVKSVEQHTHADRCGTEHQPLCEMAGRAVRELVGIQGAIAAPGEAGEFEITEHVVRAMEPNGLVAIWEGRAPGPLKAGDRLVRYRRRAPEREGGAR